MRLATRIGRLEAKMPPPPPPPVGCDLCRNRYEFWQGMSVTDESGVARCSSCGVALRRNIVIIEGIKRKEVV